jgi:hypothetical protein
VSYVTIQSEIFAQTCATGAAEGSGGPWRSGGRGRGANFGSSVAGATGGGGGGGAAVVVVERSLALLPLVPVATKAEIGGRGGGGWRRWGCLFLYMILYWRPW